MFVIGLIVPRTEPLFTPNGHSELRNSVSISPFVAGTSDINVTFDIRNSCSSSGTAPCHTELAACHQLNCAHFRSLSSEYRHLHLLSYALWTCSGRKGSCCFQASQSLWSTVRSACGIGCNGLLCIFKHWRGLRKGVRVPVQPLLDVRGSRLV